MRWTNISQTAMLAGVFLLNHAAPSLAEVCDKVVGDAWRAGDSPFWLLNPYWGGDGSILTVTAVAVAALVGLGLVIVVPQLSFIVAAVCIVLVIWESILLLGLWLDDPLIFAFANDEGCVSTPTSMTGVLILLALAWASIWRSRKI